MMPTSLSYSCDSPFFAKRSQKCDEDLEKLAEFLRTLTRQMRQFCRDAKVLTKSAEALSIHMKSGLPSKARAQLFPVMSCFGDMFAEIASAQEILAESLENSFVAPLDRFCSEEVAEVHGIYSQYQVQRDNNEAVISKYLQSDLSNFGRGVNQNMLDARAREVVEQTKRFETVRFDLVRKLNEMEARKSFEVAESCVAGILSLKTYYHTVMDRMQGSNSFIEELRSLQQRDRAAFDKSLVPLERKRQDITAVLDAMLERVEMASIFLDPSSQGGADVAGGVHPEGNGHFAASGNGSAAEIAAAPSTLSRFGAFVGGLTSSTSSKGGAQAISRRGSGDDSLLTNQLSVIAMSEECEARMKALDRAELIPFFNVRPDEEPAGAMKQGYLWRKTTRKMMDTWERRWFVLDDSKMYFISEQDDSHNINVVCELMLTNIRELKSYDLPFCFEITFANFKSTIVQAEGLREYAAWIQALRTGIEKSLVSGIPHNFPTKSASNPSLSAPPSGAGAENSHANDGQLATATSSMASRRALMRPVIEEILANSPQCAECDRPSPEWVSLNIGCLVCIECSGVHRSMGVHISKVRSLTLDDLEPAEYCMLLRLGNTICNSIYEKEVQNRGVEKPTSRDSYAARDLFIRAKYQYKAFLTNPPICAVDPLGMALRDPPDHVERWERDVATRALYSAVASNNMLEMTKALAADADISGGITSPENAPPSPRKDEKYLGSPLIEAIHYGALEAAVFLIINGASLSQEISADDPTTPLLLAESFFPSHDLDLDDTLGLFEEGGRKALCAYIFRKAEQSVRVVNSMSLRSSPPIGKHTSDGSISYPGNSAAANNSVKDESIGTGKSSSLSKKAKMFISRTSAVEVKNSPTLGSDAPVTSSSASGPAGHLQHRYRGASDFGSLPVVASPVPNRSRTSSNGDEIEKIPNIEETIAAPRRTSGSVLFHSKIHKKPASNPISAERRDTLESTYAHPSSEHGVAPFKQISTASSKISQKMRTAFNTTDFLFPSAGHDKSSTQAPVETAHHAPILGSKGTDEGHHSGFKEPVLSVRDLS